MSLLEDKDNFSVSTIKHISEMLRKSAPYISTVYIQFAAIVTLSGVGYFLDEWRGSFPFYFTIGLVVGIIIGIYNMGRLILRGK